MATTRFTKGITTVKKLSPLGQYPLPHPFSSQLFPGQSVATFATDYYQAGTVTTDYVLTGVSSTFALTAGAGGLALLTPGGAATVTTLAYATASFTPASGLKFWYNTRFKMSAVGAGVIAFAGLQNGTGATNTDGIFFTKPTGAAGAVTLVSRVGSVNTTLGTVYATSVANTYMDVGFYYNGTDMEIYADGALVAMALAPALTTANLAPFYQITPTATDTMTLDFMIAAQEVLR
jgi:hypothetical protein